MIKITLPDKSVKEYEIGVTPGDVAKSISEGLYRNSIAAVLNGELKDLETKIEKDSTLKIITLKDEEAPVIYRHTLAHIMAQAVKRVFGKEKVKLAIGPVIENGFYYDFFIEDYKISTEDFSKIEEEMKKIIKEDLKIEKQTISKEEAKKIFAENKFKIELIEDIEDEYVSIYKQGDFVDLCKGPHLPTTKYVKHFKLLSTSGAYWRGDEKNEMLQRIYATAFSKKEDLENYLHMIEEAKRRDHRKVGPQLDLFMINTDVAAGMPIFLPNGKSMLNKMYELSREIHAKYCYTEIETPQVLDVKLWHQSGHWDHYKDNMYFIEREDLNMAVKPMNCPGHILAYKRDVVSYRDLPIRLFEFGKVHRHERSGVLHGLFRVRVFTQDDAHIFCTQEQVEKEIINVMNLINDIYSVFGFKLEARLSTMPEDHMGDLKTWEIAENSLKKALEGSNTNYIINEGDGAFYGPKIDFYITDSLGKKWQCPTIQLDFQMPERFDINYVGETNELLRPVMIHRAVFGSVERFFGILIEHFAGNFPTWLSPTQVSIVPVADRFNEKAFELANILEKNGVKVHTNTSKATVGYKIREEQMKKVPYMIVFGEKEEESGLINIRTRNGNTINEVNVEEFVKKIAEEIKNRSLDLSY
jgi:threonyl-tRNA synthetase